MDYFKNKCMFYLKQPGSKLSRRSIVDVQQALYLLAATRKGEIPYQPDYGLNALYAAQGSDNIRLSEIEQEMIQAITKFEERVILNSVKVRKVSGNAGRCIRLEVDYIFESIPQIFNAVFPVR